MDVYITFLLLFTGLIICYGEYCDNTKLRRCREDIRRKSDRRMDDMTISECREFREDFDCLLDQTALCATRESEREDYGNDLVNAHSILRRICNRKEGYDRSSCFEKDSILQCEDKLPRRKYNPDPESCRKYQDFKNCAQRIVETQCGWNDKDYLRSYYMEVARDLPWKCTTDSSDRPDDRHRNRTNGVEPTCCRNERCDDRGRARDCREELIRFMDGRSNIPTYGNSHELCRKAMDAFNCMLWHSYNCELHHQKDIPTLQNGKDYIERKCDTAGDLRRSCFEQTAMKDCDRHLSEESSSPHDVTCREYESYVACMERQLSRCSPQDELLQGIHLVSKVGEKAWTCSKLDMKYSSPYDPSYTYSTRGSTQDDFYCETQARSEHRRCMLERDRLDDEARRESNHREKHVKTCCVAYQFRECTRQVVRQSCQRERSSVIDNLMGAQMNSRIAECQDVEQATCSATRMLNNAMIIVLAFAILRSIFPQD